MGEVDAAYIAETDAAARRAQHAHTDYRRFGSMRVRLTRAAVVLAMGLASALSVFGFMLAVWTLEARADRNAGWSARELAYGFRPDTARQKGFQEVVEYARAAMPEDATYHTIVGPAWSPLWEGGWARTLEPDFLRWFLLPRRERDPDDSSARWVFCFACDLSQLGPEFEVRMSKVDGLVFGELGA